MSVVTSHREVLDEAPEGRHRLLEELREVDHWRRVVAARLDLAVAVVTSLDEPIPRDLPFAPVLPRDLRDLVGLPDDRGGEAAVLVPLRTALDDLDCYALALRALLVTQR